MKETPPNFAPPRKYNTAKRRAQAENAAFEPDRETSAQPNGEQQEMLDGSQGEYESGDESDAGGDYSGLAENGYDSQAFSNPFASGLGASPIPYSPGVASPLPSQNPLDALTSLATVATSLSPQRSTQALPPTFFPVANGASTNPHVVHATSLTQPRPAPAAFIPKPLAKMPSLGEVPRESLFHSDLQCWWLSVCLDIVITEFTISTIPPSRPLILQNLQSRQHSFAVPPSTTRVDFTPSYRRQRRDGSIVYPTSSTPSQNGTTNGTPIEEEGLPVAPEVKTASRPESSLTSSDSTNAAAGGRKQIAPSSFTLIPKRGLNVAEFTLVPRSKGHSEEEVYRIFVTK